jgi:large subunit ribosomal protein L18
MKLSEEKKLRKLLEHKKMSIKNLSRIRRAKKTRMNIKDQENPRLTVYRSSKHFYAQIFDSLGTKVIASASTVEKDSDAKSNNVEGAEAVGKRVAERAIENGVKKVVFDRSGYKYHGRIKALADSARKAGLEF